jgi:hypothetical protein
MCNRIALASGIDHAVATAYRFSDHPTLGAAVVAIWSLDRMATVAGSADAMSMSVSSDRSGRAPDNELYDYGCDLVEAAAAIRRVSDGADAARAVPAVLGCIEATLHELLWAAAALENTTARSIVGRAARCADPRLQPRSDRMNQGYANLQNALADAERASAAARSLAARALVAAGAVSGTRSRR